MFWSMPERAAMTAAAPFLIVGAGQAGATAAAALRTLGHTGRIVLAGDEASLPYERPPLTKAVLADAGMDGRIGIHPAGFHDAQSIELRLGAGVVAIDAARRLARFGDGSELAFSRCLIATGGRARTLPSLPPGTPHVHYVRTLADAQALRAAMAGLPSLCVLGGGFLGLEVAATARAAGLAVSVVEAAPRLLPRAVPPEFSAWLAGRAAAAGVALRLGRSCTSIAAMADGVALAFDDGSTLHAPLLVVAIGQTPEVALARDCGLALHPHNGGIRIDAQCRTSAPDIYAAGDCASQVQPLAGEELRLESWQSANEQARIAAAAMLGVPTEVAATPWFWSDQFGCNIQMLGLPGAATTYHLRGEAAIDGTPKFMLLGLDANHRLGYAIAVNAGGDLRPLRALVGQRIPCDPAQLRDVSIPPRQLVRDALSAAASPSLS